MAVKTKSEFMDMLKARIGDDKSDEAIAFLEDATDTINDLESKANGDGVNWQEKYEQNDAAWRQKYRDRFFGTADDDDDDTDAHEEDEKPLTYDNLFKEE